MLGTYETELFCAKCNIIVVCPRIGDILYDPTDELGELEMAYSLMTLDGILTKDLETLDAIEKRYNERREELGWVNKPPPIEKSCPECGSPLSNYAEASPEPRERA